MACDRTISLIMMANATTIINEITTEKTGQRLIQETQADRIPGLEIMASFGITHNAGIRIAMAITITSNKVNNPWSLRRLII